MWQNYRAFPTAFERANDVQQKSVVTIFHRWHAIDKALIQIVERIEAIAPCFVGEWRISYDEVKCLEVTVI